MKQQENDVEQQWATKERTYVLFYASWCPHSKRFLPIFKEYAKTNPAECVEVMVDFRADLCEKFDIEYYPTVLLFKKGKVERRLDATPGQGLTKEQLGQFTSS